MRNIKGIISTILATSIISMSAIIPVYAVSNETPETPLYLFRDTINSHIAGVSATGTGYGVSSTLVNGVWETSQTFGGAGKHNTYGIYVESYIQNNKVIGLTPSVRAGGELCVLNLCKDLKPANDYVYSVDMKFSDNLSGIRLADSSDDTMYYELAIVTDDSGNRVRFTKVKDAAYDTPVITDEWQYTYYSNYLSLASDTWLTLSLAKKDNTLYWSVYNKATCTTVSSGSFSDTAPLFAGLGRLQLFAYGGRETSALTLFDNIDAKKLGATIYKDENNTISEISWINTSNDEPLIAVADYDDQGRVLEVQTVDNTVLDSQVSDGLPCYVIFNTPLTNSAVEKRLFIWDSATTHPIYSAAIYSVGDAPGSGDEGEPSIPAEEKYAILESADNSEVELVLADNTVATYINSGKGELGTQSAISDFIGSGSNKKSPYERVVKYTLSDNTVTLEKVSAEDVTVISEATYDAYSESIGGKKIPSDIEIIYTEEYTDNYIPQVNNYKKLTVSDLAPENKYSGYLYSLNNEFAFMVITEEIVENDTELHKVSPDDYVRQADRRISFNGGASGNKTIKFGTTDIKVTDNVELYVNGSEYRNPVRFPVDADGDGFQDLDDGGAPIYVTRNVLTDAMFDKFLGNAQGVITFVKSDENATRFDSIFVNYYEIGKVASVSYRNEKTTVRVTPIDDCTTVGAPALTGAVTIEIDDSAVENGDTSITVKKNGTDVELKDLVKDDIIAFATDINEIYTFASPVFVNPVFITVLASDETVKGMVVDYDDVAGTFTVGENEYKYVGFNYAVPTSTSTLEITHTYILSLDPFGRIADRKKIGTTDKFAIIERFNAGTGVVTLVLADGSRATYELDAGTENVFTYGDPDALSAPAVNGLVTGANAPCMPNIPNRIIKYRVSGSEVKIFAPDTAPQYLEGKYNPSLGKVGAVSITEYVNFIDASKYAGNAAGYTKFDPSDFVPQTEYKFYACRVNTFYSFVVFTDIGVTFTENSRFAVLVEKTGSKMTPDGEPVYGAKALYNGEETVLYWENNPNFEQGDAIFFTTDADGFVNHSWQILDKNPTTHAFTNMISTFVGRLTDGVDYNMDDWTWDFNRSAADIRLVSGYITDVTRYSITFGVADEYGNINYANVESDIDSFTTSGLFTYGIADDCQAYEYDSSADIRENLKYSIINASDILESRLVETGTDIYSVSDANSYPTGAIALIVNGDVVCIYANYSDSEIQSVPPEEPEEPEYISTANFAILEKFYYDTVSLLLADGSRATYNLDAGIENNFTYGDPDALSSTAVANLLMSSPPSKSNIQDRVVTYRISGEDIKLYAPSIAPTTLMGAKYNPNLGKIGVVKVVDGVNFIDASSYYGNIADYTKFSQTEFNKNKEYSGYAFRGSVASNFYEYVIFTDIGPTFTEDSRFAVLIENIGSKITPDGEAAYGAKALYNGEETVLYWENNPNFEQGDAIFFTTDADGFVNRQWQILDKNPTTNVFTDMISIFASGLTDGVDYNMENWTWDFNRSAADIRLVRGIVTDVQSDSITFGVANSNDEIDYKNVEVDIDPSSFPTVNSGLFTYGIADGCNAYEYNSGADIRESGKYAITEAAAIVESVPFEKPGFADIYVFNSTVPVTEATALVVNGDVVCIYANF